LAIERHYLRFPGDCQRAVRHVRSTQMAITQVTPDEAAGLLAQGWIYVDVRSEPEFAEGHPRGAYNVPLMHLGPGGRTLNQDFVPAMRAAFPEATRLVLGCATCNRSARAAEILGEAGYRELAVMRGGWTGEEAGPGTPAIAGWPARGLPVDREPAAGRSYKDLFKGVK
jgi:rhodanese-related sulfurtransferase